MTKTILPIDLNKYRTPHSIIDTVEQLKEVLSDIEQMGIAAFDYEATGLDWDRTAVPTTLAFTYQPGYAHVLPLFHIQSTFTDAEIRKEIVPLLRDRFFNNPKVIKVAHNLKYDLHLTRSGLDINQFSGRYADTMQMHYNLNEMDLHRLKEVGPGYFPEFEGWEQDLAVQMKANKWNWATIPLKELSVYAACDPDVTLRLFYYFEDCMRFDERVYRVNRNLDMFAFWALFEAEHEGIQADRALIEKTIKESKDIIDLKIQDILKIRKVAAYQIKMRERVNEEEIQIRKDKIANSTSAHHCKRWEQEIQDIKTGAVDHYEGFNIASPKQVADLLYDKKIGYGHKEYFDYKKQKHTRPTGKDHISHYKDKDGFISQLITVKSMNKMVGTYMEGVLNELDENDRVHTSFNLARAETGRLSSSGPNLQNIPWRAATPDPDLKNMVKAIKSFFVAPEGMYYNQADYSQIELRVMAHYSQDPQMLYCYENDIDIHASTAAMMCGMSLDVFLDLKNTDPVKYKDWRHKAKAVNFGFVFGMMEDTFIKSARNDYGWEVDYALAEKARNGYFDTYPGILDYHDLYIEKGQQFGWVRTLFGRKRHLPDIFNDNARKRIHAEHAAINSPIQGSAAGLCKLTMALLHMRLPSRVKLINNVHDAVQHYIPIEDYDEAAQIIKVTAEDPPLKEYFGKEFSVPLKMDFERSEKSWADIEEIKVV